MWSPARHVCRREDRNLLLEQNGAEASVEGTDALLLQHLAEAAQQAIGVGGLRDETDTGGLERAEGNVGEELGDSGRGDVDEGAVVDGVLVAEDVDGLLLEQLVSSELESTLQEVSGGGGTEASEQSAGALSLDDLLEATDHAAVVLDGVELDTGLDAVRLAIVSCCSSCDVVGRTRSAAILALGKMAGDAGKMIASVLTPKGRAMLSGLERQGSEREQRRTHRQVSEHRV